MSFQPSMDITHKRFSHLTQNILRNLDNQSLARSIEANREIAKCLKNAKFYFIRIIKQNEENFEGFEESWREVLFKIPLEMMKQLCNAVQQFFECYSNKEIRVAPLHIAVEKGSLQLCQYVIAKTNEKNPHGKLEISSAHRPGGYISLSFPCFIFQKYFLRKKFVNNIIFCVHFFI